MLKQASYDSAAKSATEKGDDRHGARGRPLDPKVTIEPRTFITVQPNVDETMASDDETAVT
jgi:hypothetical protein